MSYCSLGDKPKVTYHFANGQPITYESNVSPVDVITGDASPSNTGNYNSQGYRITFNSPQGAYGQIQFTVIDYQQYTVGGANYIRWIPCGSTDFTRKSDGSLDDGATITSPLIIDTSVHCPVAATNNNKCEITILNNGQILFKAQGDCPVNFSVACGNCPEGQCECHSDSYPGYCCLDCASVGSTIRAITNELRAKNG